MATEDECPLRTVGWGPFRLPGERRRMRRLKEKYDTLAEQFDRKAAAAQEDVTQEDEATQAAAYEAVRAVHETSWDDFLEFRHRTHEDQTASLWHLPGVAHKFDATDAVTFTITNKTARPRRDVTAFVFSREEAERHRRQITEALMPTGWPPPPQELVDEHGRPLQSGTRIQDSPGAAPDKRHA